MPQRFQDIRAWQDGMDFADTLYDFALLLPRYEMFGMASQVRRAALSIPSNIAEGHGRFGSAEFLKFLGYSRGSLQEALTCAELARRRHYVDTATYEGILEASTIAAKSLNALRGSVSQQVKR